MEYEIIGPPEDLKHFVSNFWVARLSGDEQANFIYYSTASLQTEIAFAFKPDHQGRTELLFSSVQGHTETFGQLPASGFIDILGASIYSYAVPSFLNVSTSDLINQFTDLNTILGLHGHSINEKMIVACTAQDRLNVIADYFRLQLRKKPFEDPAIIKAIGLMKRRQGMVNIRELASEFRLSQKQFERRFTQYSGFTPKLFCRITRFESAFWNCRKYDTLTAAAYAYGYYDQAHFIHDFKKFSGFSPTKFFSLVGY